LEKENCILSGFGAAGFILVALLGFQNLGLGLIITPLAVLVLSFELVLSLITSHQGLQLKMVCFGIFQPPNYRS
jgi:sulfopyruvate decarboxylase TPP-binding subunit